MVLHGTFKENYSLEKRIEKLSKLPTGRVGVIIEKARNNNSKDLPDMKSSWFAVPSSIKFGHFMFRIRTNLGSALGPERALFFLVNGEMVPGSWTMGKVRDEFKDDDGAVYVVYSAESTFG